MKLKIHEITKLIEALACAQVRIKSYKLYNEKEIYFIVIITMLINSGIEKISFRDFKFRMKNIAVTLLTS